VISSAQGPLYMNISLQRGSHYRYRAVWSQNIDCIEKR